MNIHVCFLNSSDIVWAIVFNFFDQIMKNKIRMTELDINLQLYLEYTP